MVNLNINSDVVKSDINVIRGKASNKDQAYSSLARHLLGMDNEARGGVYKEFKGESLDLLVKSFNKLETALKAFTMMGFKESEIKPLIAAVSVDKEGLQSLAAKLQKKKEGGALLAEVLPVKQKIELLMALLDKDHSKKMFGKVQAGTVFLQSVCDELSKEISPTPLRDALLDVLEKKPIDEAHLENMYDRLQPNTCDSIAIAILQRDKSDVPLRGDSSGARFFRLHLKKSFGKDNQKQLVKLFVKESTTHKIGKVNQKDGWNVTGDFPKAASSIIYKFCEHIISSSTTKAFLLQMSDVIFKNHPGNAVGILLGILQIRYLNIAAADAASQSKDKNGPVMLGSFIAKAFSNIANENGQFRGFAKDIPAAHALFTTNILGAIGISADILKEEETKRKERDKKK